MDGRIMHNIPKKKLITAGENYIFIITTLEVREWTAEEKNAQNAKFGRALKEYGFDLKIEDQRAVGWSKSFEYCNQSVQRNSCDIHETGYNYAVIEEFQEGLYPCPPRQEWWYRWNPTTKRYDPVVKPYEYRHVCNFGLG